MSLQNTRARLQEQARTLDTIATQQQVHPQYCQEIAATIIEHELELLASESMAYWARTQERFASER